MPNFSTSHLAAVILSAATLVACQTTNQTENWGKQCGPVPDEEWVRGGNLCLATTTFGVPASVAPKGLVVVLHGDVSSGGPADYHEEYAQDIAAKGAPDIVSVALRRPGYPAGDGRISDGSTNNRRDHYTPENVDAVAEAVKALRHHYQAERVILVGHSGGAATAALVMARSPAVAEGAVLISCPCDLEMWRSGRSLWLDSLSPIDFTDDIAPTATVLAVTGARDSNTPGIVVEEYIEKLKVRGVKAERILVQGAGHSLRSSFWNDGRIAERIVQLIRQGPTTGM